jgi:NAD(P)-dependent dehydrogenase (short-subunit alcohol dehydrogenase family)
MKLQGATAVVSGASQGIGQAIAQAIGVQGARVALVGRNLHGLQQTQANIKNAGGEAKIFVTDLRDAQAINQLATDVQSQWGTVDILANIAGAWHDEHKAYFGPFQDRSVDEIDIGLDVNLRAPMLLSRLFIPGMISQRQGKIINLSGVFPEFGNQHLTYYVSKTPVETFTVGLATELRKHNIQVNCISPGEVNTPSIRKFFPEHANTAIDPNIVAKLALFLLENEAADYITGEIIVIGYDGVFWDWEQVVHDLETR